MKKINLTVANIIADHAEIPLLAGMLFDGVLNENTGFPWKGAKAVPTEESIPGTGITGQFVVIDLKGLVKVDHIRIHDTHGTPKLKVFHGLNIFEPKLIADIHLTAYNNWIEEKVNAECRYIILNSDSAVSGFGEFEVYGEYIEQDEVKVFPAFPGKTVNETWGICTHDYDHVPSSDTREDLKNIADINPCKHWRLYAEINKNVRRDGTMNFVNPKPGAITIQDAVDARERGGSAMFSLVGNIPMFTETYPEGTKDPRDLPFFKWDKNLSYEENRERMYLPGNYSDIRDIMNTITEAFKDYADCVIQAPANEMDKLWKQPDHRMNPFQMAAMFSMIWDGHQGEFGKGMKDICPDMKLAWVSQAYNNLGYTKLAAMWFDHFRKDGEFCADILCTNSYCNSAGGIQHTNNSHAIPPEGTYWVKQLSEFYQYSRLKGKEFYLTEFGYDTNGSSKNSVVVDGMNEDYKLAKEFPTYQDWENWYDTVYYPKYRDALLERQMQWVIRAYLEASPYCDRMYLYHIRDTKREGSASTGTYSSCGIAWDMRHVERGNLKLKPSGEAIKNFIETLGSFIPTDRVEFDDRIVIMYDGPGGKSGGLDWINQDDSMPVIDVWSDEPEPSTPEIKRWESIIEYLKTELNKAEQQLELERLKIK